MFPFKYKARAGRHVRGQRPYEPFLDADNWCKEAIDMKRGGLSPLAIERAHEHMKNRPRFLTKIGKRRLQTVDQELFPGVAVDQLDSKNYDALKNQKLFEQSTSLF